MSTKSKARKYIEKLNDGPITFGQYVEAHRLCDDLSQTDLARRMRVSRAYLCDVEKGRRLVSVERAAGFAKSPRLPGRPFRRGCP